MKLSILIPVYNAEEHIRRCLDSVLDQNIPHTDYEILLRDDGSTDGTLAIIKEYHKNAIGSPLDPEHSNASAGVAVIAVKGLNFYPLPNPTEDYKDAEKMGRCKTDCVDIAGETLVCANVYGWSGG